MARAAFRPCTWPGCPELTIDGGRCPRHTREANRGYDQRRGTAKQRGYDSTWERVRLIVLARDHYLCRECIRGGYVNSVAMLAPVDHIIPISQRPDLRLALSNLETLCHHCHARKHRGRA